MDPTRAVSDSDVNLPRGSPKIGKAMRAKPIAPANDKQKEQEQPATKDDSGFLMLPACDDFFADLGRTKEASRTLVAGEPAASVAGARHSAYPIAAILGLALGFSGFWNWRQPDETEKRHAT